MPAPASNPPAPPQATAAHARARTTRLLGQLWRTLLFKVTAGFGILALITGLPMIVGHTALAGYGFFRTLFTICVFLLLVRVVFLLATETLWLLRNRLILAYVFMGVVPVVLIAGMLAIGAYMFYGQYASYLLLTGINQRTRNVESVNSLTVRELDRHPDRAADAPGLSNYYASYYFPRHGGVRTYFYSAQGQPLGQSLSQGAEALALPGWLRNGFTGLVVTADGYAIASYNSSAAARGEHVLTLYTLGEANLNALAAPMGRLSLGRSGFVASGGASPPAAGGEAPVLASTAPLRGRNSIFDIAITGWSFLPVRDWNEGSEHNILATIATRPSLLNDQLFSTIQAGPEATTLAKVPLILLGIIAVGFLIIEFFSLIAGIRLTRSITGAVNDLYVGTEHINRGDFEHRIPVRSRDQLSALEISFNNMTASIQRLLLEQREKQALQNELTIAHEVQAQLFPRNPPQVKGFEIVGRCLPARVVSGDYFDFLQLGPARVGLALGDISGKGISAALLMATIVSAVRAYQPQAAGTQAAGARAAGAGGGSVAVREEAGEDAGDPARVLERLNKQLYHSTPPEKYVTLFYAVYDADTRELRYTNAGHLPPVVIGTRGTRRLDRGGMVAGLFEEVSFEAGVAQLDCGDLLAAWSDGITEPENEYGVEYGEERLIKQLELYRTRPLGEILEAVLGSVHDWSGSSEQADDITLVLARVSG